MSAGDHMTDDMDPRAALALDYALGTLEGAARAEAVALEARDPAFAADVAAWRAELSPMLETLPALAPPADMFARIEAELFPAARAAAAPERASIWSSLGFWRGFSFASTAAAAALAVAVLSPNAVPAPVAAPVAEPARAAMLTAGVMMQDGDGALIAAAYDPNERMLLVTPTHKMPMADTQSMELWIIVGDAAPRSLGLLDPNSPQAKQMPADVRADLAKGAALAISIEPRGGSTTGAPTGPVVAVGKLTSI
jgi:anti-sigma-K factor RskA